MKPTELKPLPGRLLGEIISGNYVTETGIEVVQGLKRQKPEKVRVIAIGGPFAHRWETKLDASKVYKITDKEREYAAMPGEIAWFKRAVGGKCAFKNEEGKTVEHLVLKNDDIVAVERDVHDKPGNQESNINVHAKALRAVRDIILVEPLWDGFVEGSKIIHTHDQDKEYIGNVKGKVISIGPELHTRLKVGDVVFWRRHEGTKIELGGRKFLALMPRWVEGLLS